MEITNTFTSRSGKHIEMHAKIENHQVGGIVLIDGKQATITGYATVQGRKCLSISGGPAPYLPIADSLYAQIDAVCREQYQAAMSPEQQAQQHVAGIEAAYRKLERTSDDLAAIITAKTAWENAAAQHPQTSNRVHYNDPIDNNSDKVWTN